jgi:hypothetical protein
LPALPFTAPPEGQRIRRSSADQKTSCGEIIVHEYLAGSVVRVGGTSQQQEVTCGEFLIRHATNNGSISSACVHFWFNRLSADGLKLAMTIIKATEQAPELPDDPPLAK